MNHKTPLHLSCETADFFSQKRIDLDTFKTKHTGPFYTCKKNIRLLFGTQSVQRLIAISWVLKY